ncbi:MAG: SLC13 family permease, partial [Planctomycetota bacterium]
MTSEAEVDGGSEPERSSPMAARMGLVGGALLFLGFLFCPGLPLDPGQRRVAAVAGLTAALWLSVAVPVGAASLVPAALFPLLGVMPAREVAPIYLRDLVMLFLGAFIVAMGLERWGVHRRMALAVIQAVGSSRRRLVLGFMTASAFLSLWINNTATTLLMLPIVTAVLGETARKANSASREAPRPSEGELDDDPRFGWCLLLGVAYSASVGGMGTPVGTAPNQEFLGQFTTLFPEGPRLSFGDWFLAFGPLVLLFVPIAWLILTRIVYRFEDLQGAGSDAIRDERRALGPWTPAQARMATLFAATAVLWVFRADLTLGPVTVPGWSRLLMGGEATDPAWYARHKNDISDATVAVAMALLMFVVPAGRGARAEGLAEMDTAGHRVRGNLSSSFLMDWRTASRLPWEVLLLLGGGFALAHGFKVSGLDVVVGEALAPLLVDRPRWVIVGAVALLVSLLTEVTSNTATTAVLLPVMAAAGVAAGVDPRLVMLPATLAASAAFMMPVATPPNAVVFATRKIPVPAMARAGVVLNLVMVVLILLVFEFWASGRLGVEEATPSWAVHE